MDAGRAIETEAIQVTAQMQAAQSLGRATINWVVLGHKRKLIVGVVHGKVGGTKGIAGQKLFIICKTE